MRLALRLAREGAKRGEVPVGAVVVRDGLVIGAAHNAPLTESDPTAHAEMLALRAAGRALDAPRLPECDLYVTLEPCLMCLGAMIHARIRRLVFGAADPKVGATQIIGQMPLGPRGLNHRVEVVGGVLESECAGLLRSFFRERR